MTRPDALFGHRRIFEPHDFPLTLRVCTDHDIEVAITVHIRELTIGRKFFSRHTVLLPCGVLVPDEAHAIRVLCADDYIPLYVPVDVSNHKDVGAAILTRAWPRIDDRVTESCVRRRRGLTTPKRQRDRKPDCVNKS